jgi:hypothetical protein
MGLLKMRIFWRLGLPVLLVAVTAALLWAWIASLHRAKTQTAKPIADLGMTMPLNQPGGGAVPAEAYEVYSALYQAPMNEALAFAEDSETDIPQVNGSCLRPAAPQEHEMTDAFVAANQQSHRWGQKFSIGQGYRLLSHSEVAQAQMCIATHGAQCEDYKQLRYVRFLGVPGFDQAHTEALVSVIKSCGHLCGSGGIFAVERTNGTWQRSATTDFTRDCSWMY